MNQDFDFKTINDQMVEIPRGEIVLRDDRIKHIWTHQCPVKDGLIDNSLLIYN